MVAAAVKAAVPIRVYAVQLVGFDTHADERATQQRLLETLDEAVTPFLQRMASDRNGKSVVLLAYSEFGRRVKANASQGTDYGTAGPVFVAGAPVKGGFYGDEPSLADLDNGDLKPTTDFRDIYYELLSQTLQTDSTPSVGTGRQSLGFLYATAEFKITGELPHLRCDLPLELCAKGQSCNRRIGLADQRPQARPDIPVERRVDGFGVPVTVTDGDLSADLLNIVAGLLPTLFCDPIMRCRRAGSAPRPHQVGSSETPDGAVASR
jgi:hypothetical protein